MPKPPFYYRIPILMAILCVPPIGATQIGWYFFEIPLGYLMCTLSFSANLLNPPALARAFLTLSPFCKLKIPGELTSPITEIM